MSLLPDSDFIYALAINRVEGIGPARFHKLLKFFGSFSKILSASVEELSSLGLKSEIVTSLKNPRLLDDAQKEFSHLQKKGMGVVLSIEARYPALLNQISNPPVVLYYWGDLQKYTEREWLGVVGSREASPYAQSACKKIVKDVVARGVGVVSGFALGVDMTAHLTCLEAGIPTVAVLGSGFEKLSPSSHEKYISQMIEKGLMISEFSPNTPAQPQFFPRRNRIISGLSRGILVVEAGLKSGALITANYASEQNRDLFAVPGSIFDERAKGSNQLLKNGAKLVESAEDILEEWNYPISEFLNEVITAEVSRKSDLLPDEEKIIQLCKEEPRLMDQIIEGSGLKADQVLKLVTLLQMKDLLAVKAGGRYQAL